MPDREKVIKGLTQCTSFGEIGLTEDECNDCPYYEDGSLCWVQMNRDALELLKKQTKTKVVFGRTKDGEFVTECGNCGTYLGKAYSNCPKCKKELDWNSNQT